ncbi:MAG: MarR family winged helix-turn-helix transcriptional regulator [Gammaproteobacteria bacterium]
MLTDLILETFTLNGALLSAGDELVNDIGLSSARWQVLGALALENRSLTVAQISRRMGLSRQAVQRLANDLEAEGILTYQENPDHKRSRLATLTKQGEAAYSKADTRQIDWVNGLSKGIRRRDIQTAMKVLQSINDRLQQNANDEEN